ncbi:unnamed protein product [Amoebophrya sp. A25]|nr:unnamed protein product [Amoebophrya sp. A25]|eukprot:GSA25T00007883001.1
MRIWYNELGRSTSYYTSSRSDSTQKLFFSRISKNMIMTMTPSMLLLMTVLLTGGAYNAMCEAAIGDGLRNHFVVPRGAPVDDKDDTSSVKSGGGDVGDERGLPGRVPSIGIGNDPHLPPVRDTRRIQALRFSLAPDKRRAALHDADTDSDGGPGRGKDEDEEEIGGFVQEPLVSVQQQQKSFRQPQIYSIASSDSDTPLSSAHSSSRSSPRGETRGQQDARRRRFVQNADDARTSNKRAATNVLSSTSRSTTSMSKRAKLAKYLLGVKKQQDELKGTRLDKIIQKIHDYVHHGIIGGTSSSPYNSYSFFTTSSSTSKITSTEGAEKMWSDRSLRDEALNLMRALRPALVADNWASRLPDYAGLLSLDRIESIVEFFTFVVANEPIHCRRVSELLRRLFQERGSRDEVDQPEGEVVGKNIQTNTSKLPLPKMLGETYEEAEKSRKLREAEEEARLKKLQAQGGEQREVAPISSTPEATYRLVLSHGIPGNKDDLEKIRNSGSPSRLPRAAASQLNASAPQEFEHFAIGTPASAASSSMNEEDCSTPTSRNNRRLKRHIEKMENDYVEGRARPRSTSSSSLFSTSSSEDIALGVEANEEGVSRRDIVHGKTRLALGEEAPSSAAPAAHEQSDLSSSPLMRQQEQTFLLIWSRQRRLVVWRNIAKIWRDSSIRSRRVQQVDRSGAEPRILRFLSEVAYYFTKGSTSDDEQAWKTFATDLVGAEELECARCGHPVGGLRKREGEAVSCGALNKAGNYGGKGVPEIDRSRLAEDLKHAHNLGEAAVDARRMEESESSEAGSEGGQAAFSSSSSQQQQMEMPKNANITTTPNNNSHQRQPSPSYVFLAPGGPLTSSPAMMAVAQSAARRGAARAPDLQTMNGTSSGNPPGGGGVAFGGGATTTGVVPPVTTTTLAIPGSQRPPAQPAPAPKVGLWQSLFGWGGANRTTTSTSTGTGSSSQQKYMSTPSHHHVAGGAHPGLVTSQGAHFHPRDVVDVDAAYRNQQHLYHDDFLNVNSNSYNHHPGNGIMLDPLPGAGMLHRHGSLLPSDYLHSSGSGFNGSMLVPRLDTEGMMY